MKHPRKWTGLYRSGALALVCAALIGLAACSSSDGLDQGRGRSPAETGGGGLPPKTAAEEAERKRQEAEKAKKEAEAEARAEGGRSGGCGG